MNMERTSSPLPGLPECLSHPTTAQRMHRPQIHSDISFHILLRNVRGYIIFMMTLYATGVAVSEAKASNSRTSSGHRSLLATNQSSAPIQSHNTSISDNIVGTRDDNAQNQLVLPFHEHSSEPSPPPYTEHADSAALTSGSARSRQPTLRLRPPPSIPRPWSQPSPPPRPRPPQTPRQPWPPSPRPPNPKPPRPQPPSPPPSPRPRPVPTGRTPPSPSLATKDDIIVQNPLEIGDADMANEGEEPAWPPQQPYPPQPFNTPSPPPPASPADIGHFEFIGNAMMIAVHLLAVPGTDRFFFMERPSGRHPDGSRTIAGFLDLPTRRWTHVTSPDGLFCAGHTFLPSGDLLIVGGHQANGGYPDGMKSIRTFSRSCTDLQLRKIREMGWKRWYPSATLLPNGKVLIMGGTQGVGAGTANNQFWELYDHSTKRLMPYAMRSAYLDSAEQVYYPFNYVLPSGLLFTFCGRSGWILNWTNNSWPQAVPRLRGYATTQYPFTGTSVLLGLYPEKNYEVEIMLFGGQAERAVRNLSTVAARAAQRIRLSYSASTGNYTFDGWTEEPMSMGRLMGDSVLLPNGKVVILNGAREGLAGDSASGGDSRANYPVLFADLYDPGLPRGSRFRRLALSRIPRMYHSTACLTTNGTILVAGCDRCHRFFVDPAWTFDPSPTGKTDYRLEIFSPPFVFHDAAKPRIEMVQGEAMQYGNPYVIAYGWPSAANSATAAVANTITRVVLVAPCSCTHSYDMHQRLVGLEILTDWTGQNDPPGSAISSSSENGSLGTLTGGGSDSGGSRTAAHGGRLTVLAPPNTNIAPPGMYMLFLLNGDIYSSAVWVRLEN